MDPQRQGDETLTGNDTERVRLHAEYCAQLDNRRAAKLRLAPLDYTAAPISVGHLPESELLAWQHAVAHLAEHDLQAIVPAEVGRALGMRRRWWAA